MSLTTLFIPLAFIVLVSVILWMIIGGRGHWAAKAAVIVVALHVSIGLWWALGDVEGWPVVGTPPEKFALHAMLVKEPAGDNGAGGAIYLWLTETNEKAKEPRCYKLPYSKELHKELAEAGQKMRGGKRVMGERRKGQRRPRAGGVEYEIHQEYVFYDLPPPAMPQKDPKN
jgi:hypothetical protein